MIIYKATNIINNKVYIGLTTKTLEHRRQQHLNSSKRGSLYHFHNGIRKHGFENFKWEIIARSVSLEELEMLEKLFIDEYETLKKGYNMTKGGSGGGMTGKNHTQETKQKLSKAGKGRKHSEKAKMKMSIMQTGKKCSEETKQKLSKANKGKKLTQEHKQKIRLINLGKKYSIEYKNKMALACGGSKFEVFNKDNILVGEWVSQAECARELKIDRRGIGNCLNGKRKTHKSYHFKFGDYDNE